MNFSKTTKKKLVELNCFTAEYLTVYAQLASYNFKEADVLKIVQKKGGSKSLAALVNLFTPLRSADGQVLVDDGGHEISQWTRLLAAGVTADNLLAVLNHDGGSNNLAALIDLFKPLQSADGQVRRDTGGREISEWTRLLDRGVTAANIVALLSHKGGSKNLTALVDWFTPLQHANGQVMRDTGGREISQWTLLLDMGVTAADVLAVLSHSGGSKNLAALIDLFTPLQSADGQAIVDDGGREISQWTRLLDEGVTAANIVALLNNGGGSNNLAALIDLFTPLQSADGQVLVDDGGHEISQWTRLLAGGVTAANIYPSPLKVLEKDFEMHYKYAHEISAAH